MPVFTSTVTHANNTHLGESRSDCGHRADPHPRGLDADIGVRGDLCERCEPVLGHRLLAREHDGAGAVADARGGGGGDHAVLLECGLELRGGRGREGWGGRGDRVGGSRGWILARRGKGLESERQEKNESKGRRHYATIEEQ